MFQITILKPLVEYLRGQPFNNVLIAALLSVIVYFNVERAQQAKEAHTMVHSVIGDIRKENQENQNRLIFALKGVRYEVAGRPEKAAESFEKAEESLED